jgi:hypothetical protein
MPYVNVMVVIITMKVNQIVKDGKLSSLDNIKKTKALTIQQFIETYAGPDV